MATEVALDEAQARLEELVQAVEQGRSFIITRDAMPIARLDPVESTRMPMPGRVLTPEQQAARERARGGMQKGIDLGGAIADKQRRAQLHQWGS